MTLVLTRLARCGIAMAADSTLTTIDSQARSSRATPSAVKKLHVIAGLSAGVAAWGRGTVGGVDTDKWLQEFIDSGRPWHSIGMFASRLATAVNSKFALLDGTPSLGFQIAGFDGIGGELKPTFWHVHDGPSEMVKTPIDPRKVNANHDCPPDLLERLYATEGVQTMRNGDFQKYAVLSQLLHYGLGFLNANGFSVNVVKDLERLVQFNVAEIRLTADIYGLSDHLPTIGGRIDYLTIDVTGVVKTGWSNVNRGS